MGFNLDLIKYLCRIKFFLSGKLNGSKLLINIIDSSRSFLRDNVGCNASNFCNIFDVSQCPALGRASFASSERRSNSDRECSLLGILCVVLLGSFIGRLLSGPAGTRCRRIAAHPLWKLHDALATYFQRRVCCAFQLY